MKQIKLFLPVETKILGNFGDFVHESKSVTEIIFSIPNNDPHHSTGPLMKAVQSYGSTFVSDSGDFFSQEMVLRFLSSKSQCMYLYSYHSLSKL